MIKRIISFLVLGVALLTASCHGIPVEQVKHLCDAAQLSGVVLSATAVALARQIEHEAKLGCTVCKHTEFPQDCCDTVIDHVIDQHSAEYRKIEQSAEAQTALAKALGAIKACQLATVETQNQPGVKAPTSKTKQDL